MKYELTPYQKRIAKLITDGLLSTISLFFSILSIGYLMNKNNIGIIFLSISCFIMALVYFFEFYRKEKNSKYYTIRNLGLMGFYLVMMAISLCFLINEVFYFVFAMLFISSIVFDITIHLVMKHKIRHIVLSFLEYAFSVLLALVFVLAFVDAEISFSMAFIFVPLFIALIAFIHAMVAVFSRVRSGTIITIIRKTYSVEILIGLVVLIVATALVLTIMEENMSIGDALWYCFAIVTTIGFGDIVATSIVGRILSVILGIYGIVVVALITSIIVNFYNETKGDSPEKENKKIEEKTEDKEENKE
ncbi:MAG: hypothetical protein E7178_01410 [Erysipelotrichaceae bacterium]|jgi:hypothetical protein|nr:hypothetical protein [Erysipelotrichaceae bacterium]